MRRCSNSRVSRICESVLFVTVARISLGYNFYNAETVQEDAFGACGGNLLIQRAENCFEFEAAITGDELHSLRERWIQSQPHRQGRFLPILAEQPHRIDLEATFRTVSNATVSPLRSLI